MKKKQKEQSDPQTINACCPPQYGQMVDDEIDLLELVRLLLARKWLIVCLTIAGLVLAALYAFSRPVVFQSQAQISQLVSGRVMISKGFSLNSKEIYKLFNYNLNSLVLQNEVLSASKLSGYQFSVNEKKGTIALQGADPAKLAEPINTLLWKAEEKTLHSLKQQRLVQLTDALMIAEKAGLTSPVLTTANAPLYFYGTKVLNAEIMFLNEGHSVESDVAVVTSPQKTEFRTVMLSQPATVPNQPVGHKSGLVMVLGAILGFMGAIGLVFVLNMKDKILSND